MCRSFLKTTFKLFFFLNKQTNDTNPAVPRTSPFTHQCSTVLLESAQDNSTYLLFVSYTFEVSWNR